MVASKFIDALPLYRQEKRFAREGIEVSRSSMSSWMIQLDERLTPVTAEIKRALYAGAVIHIDETRLQVLDEPGREATQQSFMWVYCGGPEDRPVIWFQYADTRSGEVPKQFLFPDPPEGDSHDPPPQLYLVSDGYSAYPALARQDGIIGHGACWAHVRPSERMFVYDQRIRDVHAVPAASLAVLADADPRFRPEQHRNELWGCSTGTPLSAGRCWRPATSFALVVMAQIRAKATRDAEKRRSWKFRLMRLVYDRGYERNTILELLGFHQGEQVGYHKGEADLLLWLIEKKFGADAVASMRQCIEAADNDKLLFWSERILTADSVDAIFH